MPWQKLPVVTTLYSPSLSNILSNNQPGWITSHRGSFFKIDVPLDLSGACSWQALHTSKSSPDTSKEWQSSKRSRQQDWTKDSKENTQEESEEWEVDTCSMQSKGEGCSMQSKDEGCRMQSKGETSSSQKGLQGKDQGWGWAQNALCILTNIHACPAIHSSKFINWDLCPKKIFLRYTQTHMWRPRTRDSQRPISSKQQWKHDWSFPTELKVPANCSKLQFCCRCKFEAFHPCKIRWAQTEGPQDHPAVLRVLNNS